MKNNHLQTLLHKEMSRAEFMGVAALAAGSLFGFGHIVKLLTGKSLQTHSALRGASNSSYGK